MKKFSLIFLLSMAITVVANAQATRTWVSGVGDDVNPCSRTAPCKTFAGAISKTASPGIINCLDPGGFGAVTITKSITIDCTATLGSTLSSGVQGIIINTGLTTDKVVLRNLDINGAGTTLGTNGVNIIQAGSVSMYRVNIANYSGDGVLVSNSSNTIGIFMAHCQVLNTAIGVHVNNSGGIAKLQMEDTTVEGNSNIGVDIAGVNDGAILTRCNIARNANAQFQADQASAVTYLESTTLGPGSTGVQTGAGATVRLSRVSITGNVTNGIGGAGSTICFSNNVIAGNLGNQACSTPGQAQQ
jgi:hypothetical protein